ncbi:MAG: ABC transporter permease [Chloroflexi bacterium]|nr:ABC transporter permease [Chloroflexota bacterium]
MIRTYTWLAWRNLWRNRRRTLLTFTAVALGLVLLTLMAGMVNATRGDVLYNVVRLQGGHVEIRAKADQERRAQTAYFDLREAEALVKALRALSWVRGIAPRIRTGALALTTSASRTVNVVAIDPELEPTVNSLVLAGSPRYLDPDDRDVALVGGELAEALGLEEGDKLTLALRTAEGIGITQRFVVKAIYHSGFADYDRTHVFIPLEFGQRLLFRGITHVALLADVPERAPQRAAELAALRGLPDVASTVSTPFDAVSWQEANAPLLEALTFRDAVLAFFSVFLTVIAAFGILNTMLMSVFERVREIGVLMALGVKPGQVVFLFMMEGLLIGLLGGIAGLGAGYALTSFLERTGLQLGSAAAATNIPISSTIYPYVGPGDLGGYLALVCFISLVSSVYPAWTASRQEPAQALRFV